MQTNVSTNAASNIGRQAGQQGRAEAGQSMVEFALVIGLLLVFTFGMIDFSRAVYAASIIQASAQEGARAGLADFATNEDVEAAVQSKVVGLDPTEVNAAMTDLGDNRIQVVVTYQFSFVTPLVALAQMAGINSWEMTGNASMLRQGDWP